MRQLSGALLTRTVSCTTGKSERLFFRRMIRRNHRFGRRRRDVYILPRLGITQLLAGFFFDCRLVALEPLNLLGVAVIFPLNLLNLVPEFLVLGALLPINDHSVSAEH